MHGKWLATTFEKRTRPGPSVVNVTSGRGASGGQLKGVGGGSKKQGVGERLDEVGATPEIREGVV